MPRPLDDGAADHLTGLPVPELTLPSTAGRLVNLARLTSPRTIIYCYPMTGVPGEPLPAGWDQIPGARGCTPQSCAFRDQFPEFARLQTAVFGLSTQSPEYQAEMAARLHLPFEILSDAQHDLSDALRLPTFEVNGARLLKRLTLLVRGGLVERVWYPVFPPDESAETVLRWIEAHPIEI